MFGSAFGKQYGLRRDAPCVCTRRAGVTFRSGEAPCGVKSPARLSRSLRKRSGAGGAPARASPSHSRLSRRAAAVARCLSRFSGESAWAPISYSRHRPAHTSPSRNTTILIPAPSVVSSRLVSHIPLAGEPRAPRPHVRAPPAFASACRPPSGSRGSARAARYRKKRLTPPPPAYGIRGSVRNERGAANARAMRTPLRRCRERPSVISQRRRSS